MPSERPVGGSQIINTALTAACAVEGAQVLDIAIAWAVQRYTSQKRSTRQDFIPAGVGIRQ